MDTTAALTRRIVGIETEYGITARSNGHRALGPDEIARYLFRPIVERYSSSNVFLPNASRLYLDVGSHPEYATAECDNLADLLAHERAGDAIMDDLAQTAEGALRAEGIDAGVYLFKNNVDALGNSYGCHENYLIARSTVLKTLGRDLLAFMVTRQLICGAGMVAAHPTGAQAPGFVLSQRADQVWEGVSSATTRSRPIINTRDEPHADSARYRRMHVIVGDSSMAEPTFALKIGSTLLVLEMLEAGAPTPHLELREPIRAIRQVSQDHTGTVALELADGTTITALEIQRQLCAAAQDWLRERPEPQSGAGTSSAELTRVVELWRRTLEAIASDNLAAIDTEIDWVIKLRLLNRYRDRLGLSDDPTSWTHPKLAQLDLAYHDIRPGRGLASVLTRHGLITRWADADLTDAAIAQATTTPPQTTRAALRGQFLTHAEETGAPVTADWLRLKVNRPEPKLVELGDPFTAADDRVAELLDYMDTHAASYAAGDHGHTLGRSNR
ncbi:Pup--protein ligase [Corynebacterium uberis]|uniref:Pup--protein ligase n=1 Tax=Corynebacterium uberis TaxID=2883169 RepID=UPI001D09AD6D|nr:Pup--protein ligase [Corynebacterium uberis]UDL76866.1 Pup--protein ligase [Corynebacterium uberis]UDL79317.1 Pup--protein ligase [Corynebacterium uberis]